MIDEIGKEFMKICLDNLIQEREKEIYKEQNKLAILQADIDSFKKQKTDLDKV